MAALSDHTLQRVAAATERAALDRGAAPEALARLCREYFELGDALTLMFNDPQISAAGSWQEEAEHDRALIALIERGQAEGTIDAELSPVWIQYTLWALLYSAWSLMREQSLPRYDALESCLRSLAKVIAAP